MPHANREQRRVYEAEWRRKNRERYAENQRRWRAKNPGRVLELKRKWNDENRDVLNERSRLRSAKMRAEGRNRFAAATRTAPPACEACAKPFAETKRGACLDHDHTTGKFRGWLCQKCNTALGMVGDNAIGVRALLAYVERAGLLA